MFFYLEDFFNIEIRDVTIKGTRFQNIIYENKLKFNFNFIISGSLLREIIISSSLKIKSVH